jgi:glycosyltransferase involved in cell wall biosynthesis
VTIFLQSQNVYGGTEYMIKNFHDKIYSDMNNINNYECVVMPGEIQPLTNLLKSNKEIILWLHNLPSQYDGNGKVFLNNIKFLEKLKYVIVPSEYHKVALTQETNISLEKIYVIPNAIEVRKSDLNRFNKPNKVKIVHTSTFERGMPLLMDALQYVKNDFTLEIYNDFYPDLSGDIPEIDSRVKFFGKTPKNTVLSALEDAHIFAYPAVYLETFCLSFAEAMSAGLYSVVPAYGALEEVSNGFGDVYEYPEDFEKHIKIHAEKLDAAIDMIMDGKWNPQEQIDCINSKYSWDSIKTQWLEFDKLLSN